jgi:hypothetical protein
LQWEQLVVSCENFAKAVHEYFDLKLSGDELALGLAVLGSVPSRCVADCFVDVRKLS